MKTVLKSITKRDTFMPPPVLPAHAPTNMSMTRIVLLVPDHRLKSAVEKPVVVMMEATWNEESRSAFANGTADLNSSMVITATDTATMMK